MLKVSRDPYGFKNLLAYKKAEELQKECSLFASHFPKFSNPSSLHPDSHSNSQPLNPHAGSQPFNSHSSPSVPLKTLFALADQMNRSARSVKQNIVEGWKRNSTKEYYDFLGFSIGACAELEEDCNDIWKGIYPELMGSHFPPFDIEKIPFYPLDKSLPPILQLKLRCKELNFLLSKLQKSLVLKMSSEGTMPVSDKLKLKNQETAEGDKWEKKMLEDLGLIKLENGQVVKREYPIPPLIKSSRKC